MTLTPYPSLATLPEVIANGGKLPARSIDALSARTVYASSIPGVVLDCDLITGARIGGGTATDNAALLNAVLATATASNPVHLVIDGPSAIGSPLIIAADNTTIEFPNRGCGLYAIAGSNCNLIQNFAHNDGANYQAWQPGGAQSVTMANVTIRGGFLNGNRGTYPDGNSNGHRDGSLTNGAAVGSTPDARGPYTVGYWLCGIILVGVENLRIEDVDIANTPAFHINLYHCPKFNIHRLRLDAANPASEGQTDGLHLNGGCSYGHISHITGSVGDDLIAVNLAEGDGTGGGNIFISGVHAINCVSGVRIEPGGGARNIVISDMTMEGCSGQGVLIGNGALSGPDAALSVWIDKLSFQSVSGPGPISAVRIADHVGHLHIDRLSMIGPQRAIPLLTLESGCKISSLTGRGWQIHRNSAGNAAAYALLGSSGCGVGLMAIEGIRVTDEYGTSNTDIPKLFDFTGTALGLLTLSGDLAGVATVIDAPAGSSLGRIAIKDLSHASHAVTPTAYSIVSGGSPIPVSVGRYTPTNLAGLAASGVTLTGPGLVSSGFSFADTLVGNSSAYRSSTQSGLVYKDGSGTANVFRFGSSSSAGASNAALFVSSSNSGQGTPLTHADAAPLRAGTSAWTIFAFFKTPTDGTLTAHLEPIVSKWGSSNFNKEFILCTTNGDSKMHAFVEDGAGGVVDLASVSTLTTDTWYFAALQYDGTLAHLFINAVEQGSGSAATMNAGNSAPFMIGGDASGGGFTTSGSIAMVGKYPSALGGTLLTWLYNGGSGRSRADILSHAGLTTPNLLVCFDDPADLGHDASTNAYDFTNAQSTGPTQTMGPGTGGGSSGEVIPVRVVTPKADTDGSTITFDFSVSDFHSVVLGGNRTLTFSGATPGQVVRIELVQPASGGPRTVTFTPTIRWPSATAPTLATGANKADLIVITVRADGTYAGALSLANY